MQVLKKLMSSVVGSPAKIYRKLARVRGLQVKEADYGQNSQDLLKSANQNTPSLKMSQDYEAADLTLCLRISGRSGMTRNGTLYQLPALDPFIKGKEYGLLPTPLSCDWRGRGPNSRQQGLPEVIKAQIIKKYGHEKLVKTGKINPEFIEWLMGYPVEWTYLDGDVVSQLLETASSRK